MTNYTKRHDIEKERIVRQGNSSTKERYLPRFTMPSYMMLLYVVVLVLPSVVEMKYLGPKLSRLVMNNQTGIVYVGGKSIMVIHKFNTSQNVHVASYKFDYEKVFSLNRTVRRYKRLREKDGENKQMSGE